MEQQNCLPLKSDWLRRRKKNSEIETSLGELITHLELVFRFQKLKGRIARTPIKYLCQQGAIVVQAHR